MSTTLYCYVNAKKLLNEETFKFSCRETKFISKNIVNTHICYNLLLLLPAAWEILVYEVTCFFVCLFVFLHQYESAIISFCVRIECLVSMTQKCGLG